MALGSGEPDIFLAYLRSIYSLGVLGTKTFEGKVASYKIAHKKKVLEDSDEFPNIRFARYRGYWFRKFRVHLWLGHDECHDEVLLR